MESMSSNLKASLPLNIEEDAELTDRFKDSALSITALFKHSQKSRKVAFAQGYSSCVSDLRDYIRSNAEPEKPLTVGVILDYLESRQVALLRDLDMSSTSPSKSIQVRAAKSPSPASARKSNSPPPTASSNMKKSSARSVPIALSPPRIAPWGSPSLSPTPLPEPAWPNSNASDMPQSISTAWPEVSVLSVLPITATGEYSAALPSVGGKRKRDALAEVEQRGNAGVHLNEHHRRHHNGSKKRKGNLNKGGLKTLGNNGNGDDWTMNMDEDTNERDRKRPSTDFMYIVRLALPLDLPIV